MKSAGSQTDFMKHVQAAMVVIRQQRQRACLERICRALRRQQLLKNVDQKIVETELEAAVQQGELYAVDKHGYRSYQVENVPYNTCICVFFVRFLLISWPLRTSLISSGASAVESPCKTVVNDQYVYRVSMISARLKILGVSLFMPRQSNAFSLSSSCLSRLSMNRRRPVEAFSLH